MARLLLVLIVGAVLLPEPAAARTGLVCMAPTEPTDAGQPFSRISRIEFYLDGGNPLAAYTVPLIKLTANTDAEGRVVNSYAITGATTATVSIVFAAETPLVFELAEVGYRLVTLGSEDDETAALAGAVPGIACWRVETDDLP